MGAGFGYSSAGKGLLYRAARLVSPLLGGIARSSMFENVFLNGRTQKLTLYWNSTEASPDFAVFSRSVAIDGGRLVDLEYPGQSDTSVLGFHMNVSAFMEANSLLLGAVEEALETAQGVIEDRLEDKLDEIEDDIEESLQGAELLNNMK